MMTGVTSKVLPKLFSKFKNQIADTFEDFSQFESETTESEPAATSFKTTSSRRSYQDPPRKNKKHVKPRKRVSKSSSRDDDGQLMASLVTMLLRPVVKEVVKATLGSFSGKNTRSVHKASSQDEPDKITDLLRYIIVLLNDIKDQNEGSSKLNYDHDQDQNSNTSTSDEMSFESTDNKPLETSLDYLDEHYHLHHKDHDLSSTTTTTSTRAPVTNHRHQYHRHLTVRTKEPTHKPKPKFGSRNKTRHSHGNMKHPHSKRKLHKKSEDNNSTTESLTTSITSEEGSNSDKTWTIGIIVGTILLITCFIFLIRFCRRRQKHGSMTVRYPEQNGITIKNYVT